MTTTPGRMDGNNNNDGNNNGRGSNLRTSSTISTTLSGTARDGGGGNQSGGEEGFFVGVRGGVGGEEQENNNTDDGGSIVTISSGGTFGNYAYGSGGSTPVTSKNNSIRPATVGTLNELAAAATAATSSSSTTTTTSRTRGSGTTMTTTTMTSNKSGRVKSGSKHTTIAPRTPAPTKKVHVVTPVSSVSKSNQIAITTEPSHEEEDGTEEMEDSTTDHIEEANIVEVRRQGPGTSLPTPKARGGGSHFGVVEGTSSQVKNTGERVDLSPSSGIIQPEPRIGDGDDVETYSLRPRSRASSSRGLVSRDAKDEVDGEVKGLGKGEVGEGEASIVTAGSDDETRIFSAAAAAPAAQLQEQAISSKNADDITAEAEAATVNTRVGEASFVTGASFVSGRYTNEDFSVLTPATLSYEMAAAGTISIVPTYEGVTTPKAMDRRHGRQAPVTTVFNDGYCFIEGVTKNQRNANPETILHRMRLFLPENAVIGIMGESSPAKTTLMNVLTDSIPSNLRVRASLILPGTKAIVPHPDADNLTSIFTCRTYLEHCARLTGATIMDPNAAKQRINQLLKQLGLVNVQHVVVGDCFTKGLSDGQKRRLSIALAAFPSPCNLFVDEPTFGVDDESSLWIMQFLKRYTRQCPGRRVIISLHRPPSYAWEFIDHTVLLREGKLMYTGSRTAMEDFFCDVADHPTPNGWNPADHYVMMVGDDFNRGGDPSSTVDDWAERYDSWSKQQQQQVSGEGGSGKNTAAHHHHHRRPLLRRTPSMHHAASQKKPSPVASVKGSTGRVTIELTYRCLLIHILNPGLLRMRLAIHMVLSLVVGALFWDLGSRVDNESVQQRAALAFINVLLFTFVSLASLPIAVTERAIIDKESSNLSYAPILCQISQAIASIPITALLALLVTGLIFVMTGMSEFSGYYLTLLLSMEVSEALVLLLSHAVSNSVVGMALLAGLYAFFIMLQGFIILPSHLPASLAWLYHIGFHSYAWRSLMVTEFGLPNSERSNQRFAASDTFPTSHDVLVHYEIEEVERSTDMIVLFAYGVGLRLISIMIVLLRCHFFHGKIQRIARHR